VVEDNGKVHDTDSAYFTVRDCGPSCDPPPGWTQTYRCNGNVLERLYVNDDCREEWRTWEDCSSLSPPCQCKYALCVPVDGKPDPENDDKNICENCESYWFGDHYPKNGRMYQRYKECSCVDGECICKSLEKEVPCEGTISGHVYDAETRRPINGAEVSCHGGQYPCYPNTDSGGFYRSGSCFCPSTNCDITCTVGGYESSTRTEITDSYGNKEGVDFYLQPEISEVKFRGEILRGGEDESSQAISFYEFVVKITEILDDNSGSLNVGDRVGVSSHRDGKARVDIAYNGDTVEVFGVNMGWDDSWWYGSTTDSHIVLSESPWDGEGYYLIKTKSKTESKCEGTISGHIYDPESPISPRAALLICQDGGDCFSILSQTSLLSYRFYRTDQTICPSTVYEITCTADGYKTVTENIITDVNGNAWKSFALEPDLEEKYIRLAEYWSPVINQDISKENPKADYILKFNFDGDFNAWNNKNNLARSSPGYIASCGAHVYYWVVETETHYFIGYGIFHPLDWKELEGHENDFEGIILCIEKDLDDPSGAGNFYKMKTIAHHWDNSYMKSDVNFIEEVNGEKVVGIYPVVYVEPKGHGTYSSQDLIKTASTQVVITEIPIFSVFILTRSVTNLVIGVDKIIDDLSDGIGIVYVNSTKPGVLHYPPNDWPENAEFYWPIVNYELVTINELWDRCGEYGEGKIYSDATCTSFGGGKAKPPWGWVTDLNDPNPFLDPVNLFKLESSEIIGRSYDI